MGRSRRSITTATGNREKPADGKGNWTLARPAAIGDREVIGDALLNSRPGQSRRWWLTCGEDDLPGHEAG